MRSGPAVGLARYAMPEVFGQASIRLGVDSETADLVLGRYCYATVAAMGRAGVRDAADVRRGPDGRPIVVGQQRKAVDAQASQGASGAQPGRRGRWPLEQSRHPRH